MAGQVKVTLQKSTIGSTKVQKDTVKSLGLKRRGRSRLLPDNPCVRGAIKRISHLLVWEEA